MAEDYVPDPREKPLQWAPSLELGGGSGTGLQVFEGQDPSPPTVTSRAALSFPVGGGPMTQWSPSLQAWV